MSEHKHKDNPVVQKENEKTHKEHRELERERHREADKDILAKDEPFVLESSESDPELPAMQEFEIDADGPKGSTKKHPGAIWIIVAIVAVVALIITLICVGDWMTPNQAEKNSEIQFEEQTVPEDLGEN